MARQTNLGRRILAGAVSGLFAGVLMAVAMMANLASRDRSVWINANLIAAMWYGERVATTALTSATMAGFATHLMASTIMGVLAIPFVFGLPRWRALLNSMAFALASYPVAFATIMVWADPIMFRRSELLPMTAMHAIFGFCFGLMYPQIAKESPLA